MEIAIRPPTITPFDFPDAPVPAGQRSPLRRQQALEVQRPRPRRPKETHHGEEADIPEATIRMIRRPTPLPSFF